MKAFYDWKVKSFEMKNESFLMKEKTKINIANKILSLFACVQASNSIFWRYPLYSWKENLPLFGLPTSLASPL